MAQCPECGSPIKEDFGIVNCAQCGSMLVIDMDGNVAINSSSQDSSQETTDIESPPPTEPMAEEAFSFEGEAAPADLPSEEVPPQEYASQEEVVDEEPMEFTEEPVPMVEVPPPLTTDNFVSDIQEFANSDQVQVADGLLRYKLIIEGVDTGDIRQEIKEALTDKKFIWDVEALLRNIQDGCLVIEDVTAVKAALLVNRIKFLPVQIRWEQHAIFDN